MERFLNVLKGILMWVSRKTIELAKHPRTRVVLTRGFKQAISLLKIKAVRGIALLYLAGLFIQNGHTDASVGCCLFLLIDNSNLVLSLLGYGKRKRRYY